MLLEQTDSTLPCKNTFRQNVENKTKKLDQEKCRKPYRRLVQEMTNWIIGSFLLVPAPHLTKGWAWRTNTSRSEAGDSRKVEDTPDDLTDPKQETLRSWYQTILVSISVVFIPSILGLRVQTASLLRFAKTRPLKPLSNRDKRLFSALSFHLIFSQLANFSISSS